MKIRILIFTTLIVLLAVASSFAQHTIDDFKEDPPRVGPYTFTPTGEEPAVRSGDAFPNSEIRGTFYQSGGLDEVAVSHGVLSVDLTGTSGQEVEVAWRSETGNTISLNPEHQLTLHNVVQTGDPIYVRARVEDESAVAAGPLRPMESTEILSLGRLDDFDGANELDWNFIEMIILEITGEDGTSAGLSIGMIAAGPDVPELPAGALAPVMGLIGAGAWLIRHKRRSSR